MPPDDRHWLPVVVARAVAKPADVAPPAATKASPPVPVEVSVTVAKDAAVAPRGWKFVPERDANNLIVEIIATPI